MGQIYRGEPRYDPDYDDVPPSCEDCDSDGAMYRRECRAWLCRDCAEDRTGGAPVAVDAEARREGRR